ncbi:antitoxin Xre/MbcA/ParS toxin-binding domain-containing protein [Spirosoma utsteinense]|uniref:Toxin-antitoxin system antitoxin component (TIGR02293 family) n=1 Tax=Spirosoma utsteinense TaxID=2585773 RepID=A0ABR6WF85_9BACT|nr:antitoxin Xre/MbcA/ParS toxin-binding domain-containing protein [Spirosoma utsteinense]MBC3789289.1 putative toxin-antitoxin system antitoxin component (TIGR02293 family) [Spirosoma utsteinense]MBC3795210.1 putative toxin-antitoxin system antitoxin component (TIGR02293 family) [Spirosoma utsteinense]
MALALPFIAPNPSLLPRLLTEQEIITRSRQGVLRAEADRVAGLVGLTDKELAATLGLSASYLHRLKVDQRISQDASERLLLLENLLLHALDTFEERSKTVLSWLRSPLRELDYQTPLQALDTVTGYTLVDRVLGRIDHGIFG